MAAELENVKKHLAKLFNEQKTVTVKDLHK